MSGARSASRRRARTGIAALGCGAGLALSPAGDLNAAPEPVPSFETVRTFLGKDFQAPHFYRPWGLASGDLNDDGWPDVVVVARGVEMNPIGSIFIFMNLGADASGWNGFAEPVAPILDVSVATKPYHVAIGDLDDDPINMPDIAVAATGSDQVYIFLNEGTGTFDDPVPYNVPSNFSPRGIALGYFSDDTNGLDIAVASDVEDRVVVLQNDGSGSFSFAADVTLNTGVPSYTLVGGEYDATLVGEDDLVTPDWASGAQCSPPFVNDTISLMTNIGNYTYDVSQSYGNCSDVRATSEDWRKGSSAERTTTSQRSRSAVPSSMPSSATASEGSATTAPLTGTRYTPQAARASTGSPPATSTGAPRPTSS